MRSLLSLVCTLVFLAPIQAEDWPQWMGPRRDNSWNEQGLLDKFPDGGPKVVWRTPVAIGYSGPAVADGRVFITDFVTDQKVRVSNFGRKQFTGTERVLCLDEKTGKVLWKHGYDVTTNISYPSGPRCTPAVVDGKVYTLGAVGHLFCFDAKSGKIVWSKNLAKDYNTKPALWGYAAHPFVNGKLLYTLGGTKGNHVIALDKDTGKEVWKAQSASEQGYSAPRIIKAAGVEQLIVLSPDAVASLNPKTGAKYWSVPYKASNGSIIMTPIRWKDYLFVGGYNRKNMMLKLNKDKPGAEPLWQNDIRKGLSPVNIQPYLDEKTGIMYGSNADGKIYAVKIPSGERLWDTSAPISKRAIQTGTVFLVRQGDRFWMFNEKGELVLAKLSAEGYQEIDRAKILEPTNNAFGRDVLWSMPAFANKCAFIRNDEEIVCVSLAK